jgi:hypothetical protein
VDKDDGSRNIGYQITALSVVQSNLALLDLQTEMSVGDAGVAGSLVQIYVDTLAKRLITAADRAGVWRVTVVLFVMISGSPLFIGSYVIGMTDYLPSDPTSATSTKSNPSRKLRYQTLLNIQSDHGMFTLSSTRAIFPATLVPAHLSTLFQCLRKKSLKLTLQSKQMEIRQYTS